MKTSPSTVSIILVSWNTRELLRACLRSVYAQADSAHGAPLELILIDNASTDGTPAAIRAEFPAVRLIHNPVNVGFAAANNQGLSMASGEILILLNPDTELRPGSVAALADFMDAYPTAGAAGALLLNPDGTLQDSAYPMLGLGREIWRMLHLDRLHRLASYPLEDWASGGPRGVGVAQGACLALRRKALESVGLLDEQYFMYTEEVDLCYRMARAGWGVYWVPQARVLHYGGQSTRQAETEMFLRLYESKVRFFRKHFGAGAARLYKAILAVVSVPRIFAGALPVPGSTLDRAGRSGMSKRYRRLLGALHHM